MMSGANCLIELNLGIRSQLGSKAMAKSPPSFNLFPGDLIKSTSAMAADVFGAYFRLLCYQWEHGAIPRFVDERARVAGVDPSRWDSVWARMSDRFEVIDDAGNLAQGRLHNQRMFDMQNWTFSKAKQKAKPTLEELSKIRSEAGKLGGRPHKPKSKIKQNKAKQSKWEKGIGNREVGKRNLEDGIFDRFWESYPRGRREKKKEARIAFKKAINAGVDSELLIAKAAEYAASPTGRGPYVKGPVPWLNQGCWDDDPAAWQSDGSDKKPQDDFQYPKLGNANGRPG